MGVERHRLDRLCASVGRPSAATAAARRGCCRRRSGCRDGSCCGRSRRSAPSRLLRQRGRVRRARLLLAHGLPRAQGAPARRDASAAFRRSRSRPFERHLSHVWRRRPGRAARHAHGRLRPQQRALPGTRLRRRPSQGPRGLPRPLALPLLCTRPPRVRGFQARGDLPHGPPLPARLRRADAPRGPPRTRPGEPEKGAAPRSFARSHLHALPWPRCRRPAAYA